MFLSPRSPSQISQPGAASLATWIWDPTMITDATQSSQFFSFAQEQGLERAYLQIDSDIENGSFESFIEKCNTSGIVVDALIGNAEWILGTGTPSLQSNLEWIEQYQGNASCNARFESIHMDIELWSLDNWESLLDTYILSWKDLVTNITSFAGPLDMPVAADLPFWTYTMSDPTTGKTMDVWMLEALDSVTFMTYRNTVDGLLEVAEQPLAVADQVGKPVWLAVDTVETTEDKISFRGVATVSELASTLGAIGEDCNNHTSFQGIAVHDYPGWLALG